MLLRLVPMPFLLFVLFCRAVLAGQTAFETSAGPRVQSFRYAWVDGGGVAHAAAFTLPAATVARELSEPVRLPLDALAKAQLAGVEAYARGLNGPKVTAKAGRGGAVAISVSGRDRARMNAALAGAEAASAAARASFLAARGWSVDDRGRLRPDHARIAADMADDVGPVAVALGMPPGDPREGLARALSFVQSIPYERHRKNRQDAGFRRPLSVLAMNRADCDGKATLFLALVRAAYPSLGAAMVYIPNHALVGLAIEPVRGDSTFKRDGVRFVLAEPVGPSLTPLGEGSGRSERRAFFGALDVVPVP